MFKIFHQNTSEEIIILDPVWETKVNELRIMDAQDLLLCPGCKQPVRVRAGDVNIWHFAHKHLANCSYGETSPTLLQARAALYTWLFGKYGDKVTIEKQLADMDLPREIDCWVEDGNTKFGYWIFDGAMKSIEMREKLREQFKKHKIPVNWVFISDMLHPENDSEDKILLTTTEREFLQKSKYDESVPRSPYDGVGQSLHYINSEERTLISYRSLRVFHEPQVYSGHKRHTPFSELKISRENGEFVHPEEIELLKRYRQEATQAKKDIERYRQEATQTKRNIEPQQRFVNQFRAFVKNKDYQQSTHRPITNNKPKSQDSFIPVTPKEEAQCVYCGRITSDWWLYDGATKTCKCNNCSGKQ